jgi:hypothetical protein
MHWPVCVSFLYILVLMTTLVPSSNAVSMKNVFVSMVQWITILIHFDGSAMCSV